MTISWTKNSDDMGKRARRRALMTGLGIFAGILLVCAVVMVGVVELYSREADSAPARLSPRDLRPGECFNEIPDRDFFQLVNFVPCAGPHFYETYGRIPILADDTGSYPGDEYVNVYASAQCDFAFEAYVGVPAGRAPLTTHIIQPNAEDWGRIRRDVICILSSQDGSLLTEAQFNNYTLSTEINIMAATEGECLIAPEVSSDNLVTGLAQTTACGQLHDLEVYAVVPLREQTYPGLQTVAAFADEQCTTEFESYVGIPQSQSSLGYDTYFPSEQGWSNGEKNIVCVLLSQTGERLRGSMAGTGISTQPEGTTLVRDLAVGDCFDDTEYSYQISGSVISKSCDQPHYNELFYREDLPEGSESGPDIVALEAASNNCQSQFADYVGLDYNDSALSFYTIAPTVEEWISGERAHLCVLYDRDFALLDAPMQNSGEASAWVNRYDGVVLTNSADLAQGNCFLDPKDFDYTRPLVTLPCIIPHENEVIAVLQAPQTGDYPGEDSLYFTGIEACKPEFEPYVGLPYEDSILELYLLFPTEAEWNQGARTLTCFAYDPENFVLSASVRDSGTTYAFPDSGIVGERADLTALQVGDCIEFPANFAKSHDVIKVDCAQPHSQEVFAVSEFPAPANAPYPDYIAIDTRVAEVCRSAFEGYVGLPYTRSTLDYTFLGLSAEGWTRGERGFVCSLMDSTFNPLPASMRSSGDLTAFPADIVENATRVPLRSLPAESCYYQPSDYYKTGEVLQVACDAPHGYELYAVVDYPNAEVADTPYPEFGELTTYADESCLVAFADYIGIPFGESFLGYTTDYPNEREWLEGDRRVFCLIFGYNYEEFEGLLKGSRR